MNKKKHLKKGQAGYINASKKFYILIVAAFAAAIAALYVTGICIYKDNKNILTVAAILTALPAAKFAVTMFLFLPRHSVEQTAVTELEQHCTKFPKKYDCLFSTKEKACFVPALVITGTGIFAYTADTKVNLPQFEAAVRKFLGEAKIDANVTVFQDWSQFIKRADLIEQSNSGEHSAADESRIQRIWNSCRCMCM